MAAATGHTISHQPSTLNAAKRPWYTHERWRYLIGGFLVASLITVIVIAATSGEKFTQRSYSHELRQNSNPYTPWSRTQHEAQTYQIPKNIPVYQPGRGALTQYMSTRNPVFD